MVVDSRIAKIYRNARIDHYLHFFIPFTDKVPVSGFLASYALICYKRGISDNSGTKLFSVFLLQYLFGSATVKGSF